MPPLDHSNSNQDLPPLRDVIAQYGLSAHKALGQHFLLDLNLTRKIARAAGNLAGTTVIEVGPGPGGLSRSLMEEGCIRLILIEKDTRFIPALTTLQQHYQGDVEIIEADALKVDETQFIKEAKSVRVVANLPYNVGTVLLAKWLSSTPWPPWFENLTVMLQKEVVDRTIAAPGSKTYGRLSVLCQWHSTAKKLFDVPASAFVPPPKVESSVLQITPIEKNASPALSDAIQKVTAAAFGQRRKMLRSSLKSLFEDPLRELTDLNIDPNLRAENIKVDEYVELAKRFVDIE